MGTVVIGIVDDGIAFAHERFRNSANGSRVHYALLQKMAPSADLELTQAQIDALIPSCTHGGIFDDEEFYRRAGWIDMARPGHKAGTWRTSHGTHVMDLACGYDPRDDRNDRPIVCVQLPAEVTANPGNAARSTYAIDAMRYILRSADRIAGTPGALPVVINFSYGAIAGPHDGTSEIEAQIDDLVRRRKNAFGPLALEVVLPAGNSHLSRCHAQVSFASTTPPDNVRVLHWRVMPDDFSPSFMEFWLPCRTGGTGSRVKLTLKSPNGRVLSIEERPNDRDFWGAPAHNHAEVRYRVPAPGGRGRFLVLIQPTTAFDRAALLAPAGVWTITLENQALAPNEVVHAWIERDDTPYGYPLRGRQSYFDEVCHQRFDHAGRDVETDDPACPVTRAGLINSIATGGHPIVMGALLRKEMVVAKYSAGGPILARCGGGAADPYRPDAVTVGEDSRVHRGILAAGSRSGSVAAMGGTSVAAPQITRWIADRLAQGLTGNREDVHDFAAAQEPHPPPAPKIPPLPDPRYGAGRIVLAGGPRSILDTLVPRPRFVES
jgi:hypothetical protein